FLGTFSIYMFFETTILHQFYVFIATDARINCSNSSEPSVSGIAVIKSIINTNSSDKVVEIRGIYYSLDLH
ncbi:MAG: hypothetical protein RID25_02710, partial [Cyclobacteriaceae bacterium]